MTQPRHHHGDRQPGPRRNARELGLHQPAVVVYRQPQVLVEADVNLDDQAKLALKKLMRAARVTIQGRVNSLPGSGASTELWLRYRQIENAAAAVGQAGDWSKALEQFRSQYTTLLTAAPTGEPEKIGYGSRGVGHADCCGKACVGCPNCRGRRACEDLVNLLQRASKSLEEGDHQDASRMVQRAQDVLHKLEPKDAKNGLVVFESVRDAVNEARPGVSGTRVMRRSQCADERAGDAFRGQLGVSGTTPSSMDDAVRLSSTARGLAESSKSLVSGSFGPASDQMAASIVSQSQSVEADLNRFEPWTDSNKPPTLVRYLSLGLAKDYDDSSIIRTNLQIARNNVEIWRGNRGQGWTAQGPLQSVDLFQETLKETPGAVRERVSELGKGLGASDCLKFLTSGSFSDFWQCLPDGARKAVQIGGVALAGYAGYRGYKAVRG